MKAPIYRRLAQLIQAMNNCEKTHNMEWFQKHQDRAYQIVRDWMPSGSGIDAGTQLLLDQSRPNRLVFTADFHHMNDAGYYDGWTEHKVVVVPSLAYDFDLRVTGRDRNQIKDYLADVYHCALVQMVD